MTDKLTGGNTNYYLVRVNKPKRLPTYDAECEDIIRVLKMTFSEGCAFKAIWRSAAARLGNGKPGSDKFGIYDGEKIQHYGVQVLEERIQDRDAATQICPPAPELLSRANKEAGKMVPPVPQSIPKACIHPPEYDSRSLTPLEPPPMSEFHEKNRL